MTTTSNSTEIQETVPLGTDRRVEMVGRFTLWSVTLTGTGILASAVLILLWLITPIERVDGFATLLKTVLGISAVSFLVSLLILFVMHRRLVPPRSFLFDPIDGAKVHVALTAYNDEACIADAVREFKSCPLVDQVIIVENNSRDRTRQEAEQAGADRVVTETVPGYGSCCMRSLAEAAQGLDDHDVIVLCEGDMTFKAADVRKMLAYLENCHLVLGTRATQELRETQTQMDWLINPGNQLVAKMVQTRFWGTRLTDMGCTYRAMRVGAYRVLKPRLSVLGNHYSPHMFIEALKLRMRVIEIPVCFRARAGLSKGVGSNKIKAAKVALRMIELIYRA